MDTKDEGPGIKGPGTERPATQAVPGPGAFPAREAKRTPGGPALTGDPRVDAVLAGLDRVPGQPVAEHAALYTELHDGLLAALNEELIGERGTDGPSAVPGPGVG